MANWRGAWSGGTAYSPGDSVSYGGVNYYCVTTSTGQVPTGGNWIPQNIYTGPPAAVTGGAPLASPAFTGTPTAPTEGALTGNTDLATTAYADSAVGVEKTRALGAESALTSSVAANTASVTLATNNTSQVFSPMNYSAAGNGTTDDSTAVLAAFTAAAAVHGIVDLGRYTFLTSAAIPTFTGMLVRGSSQEGGQIVNNTSSIFTLTSGNYDITFENCQLTASAGHIWDGTAGPSLSFIRILGVKAVQSGTTYSLWSQTLGSFIDCEIDKKCNFTMSAAATVAGWNMVKTGATSVCFDHLRTNAGNNPNVPFFNFDMNSAAGYMQDLSFKNIVIEQSPAGGIACAGVFGVTVEHVRGWDANAFSGNFLSFVTSANNYPCRNIRVTQSAQIQHGAGAGSWFDIYADANCTNIILDTDGTWGTQPAVSTPAMQTTILNMTGTSLNVPSVATFPGINVAGITGSTAASRYVGATASGHPATGAHLLGDWCPDQTGAMWICTAAGTPGTWIAAGPTAASPLAVGSGGTGGTTAATARANLGIAGSVNDPLQMGYNANYTVLAPFTNTFWTNNGAMGAVYSRLVAAGYPSAHLGFNISVSAGNCCAAYYTTSGSGTSQQPTGGQLATSGAVATPAIGVAAVALGGGGATPNVGDWVGLAFDNLIVTVSCFTTQLNSTTMTTGSLYNQPSRTDTSLGGTTNGSATVTDTAAVAADVGKGIQVAPRSDTGCGTNSTTTVTDSHAVSTDVGSIITGTGIPAGATVTAVSAGTGYTISAAATATASSLTFLVYANALPANTTITAATVSTGYTISANATVTVSSATLYIGPFPLPATPASLANNGGYAHPFIRGLA